MNSTEAKLLDLALRSGKSHKSLNSLKLFHIRPALRKIARVEFKNGNPKGFVCMAPSQSAMQLVMDNIYPLLKRGIFEEAFMYGYVAGRIASTGLLVPDEMEFLLSFCDRGKLLKAGDPLPEGDRYVLYRGVGDEDDIQSVRRWSWTSSLEKAWWFAKDASKTYGTNNPAVYRLEVEKGQVLAYTNQRKEEEYIVHVRSKDRLVKVN